MKINSAIVAVIVAAGFAVQGWILLEMYHFNGRMARVEERLGITITQTDPPKETQK